MDLQSIVSQMDCNARSVQALVAGCSDQQARWKPDRASWSILEVINHLLDEECEDFRARLELLLYRRDEAWSPIDPQGWVVARGYNQRALGPSLEGFLAARTESLAWLRGLDAAAWDAEYRAPFGRIRAGDILAAWAVHDVLHLRQLVELKWQCLVEVVKPYRVGYAGEW